MIVAGGAYYESCDVPERSMFGGSGLRAASLLARAGLPIRFISSRSERDVDVTDMTTQRVGIEDVLWLNRTVRVGFAYFTPLSRPSIFGRGATIEGEIPEVADDVALVFGMIEGRPRVKARRLTYDPQQPLELSRIDLDGLTFDELVVVLNERECRSAGRNNSIEVAARTILSDTRAVGVVVKRGPRGALIVDEGSAIPIGPVKTSTVWPIGSGDAFAAGVAAAWSGGASLVDAALVGSRVASFWCGTSSLNLPSEFLDVTEARQADHLASNDALVYLAGPFFTLPQRWLVNLCRDTLSPWVFSPLHDVGRGGIEVAAEDLKGVERSAAMLALVDGSDPGTLFEVGWATKYGMPVVAYGEQADQEGLKMLLGTNAEVQSDISTAVYRAAWTAMQGSQP